MSKSFFITICCLMLSQNNGQISSIFPNLQSGSVPNYPFINTQDQQQSPQNTVELKSPLLRKLISQLEPKESNSANNDGIPGEPNAKSTIFLNSFLQHLETRRVQNQNFVGQTNRLALTIRDGSSNAVNIEFIPNLFSDERQENWNSIVELLADSLAFIIQEAERLGYNPNFKYSVILGEIQPMIASGPGLSGTALKSAVG